MKNVLIINQSAELYGADKALLELLENYPKGYRPIVVLHQDGPFKDILQSMGIKVIKCSVVKVKRGILRPGFFLKLPFDVFVAFRTIRKELNGEKIHLVHSNAISVFIGAFYSRFFRIRHIWHVHEIIESPKSIAWLYPRIVSLFSDAIIFNSNASREQFWQIKPNTVKKGMVIHNGQQRLFPISSDAQIAETRKNLFKIHDENAIIIGLVGRISRLKGQKLLLKAFRDITTDYPNVYLVYVGSAPDGQEHFLENLEVKISEYDLSDKVRVVDFQKQIWPVYDALDIVTVPSSEPESFGLVATEAMLSSKPVIGSRIGGLTEIIAHEVSGFLFENKNATELASALKAIIDNPKRRVEMGQNGKKRVTELFSTTRFVNSIAELYDRTTL